jgi:methionyl-tRNA formyltransferase
MYKNILVISDNLYLCKELEKIICELNLKDINWSFSISPFSNFDSFSKALKSKISVINLKSDIDVEAVCNDYDLVLSIHCKQLFPNKIVNSVKCINVHPGYNPFNRGWYPQVFAIINDYLIGATIHEIDNELDHGLIIDRALVEKFQWDTSLSLYNKIVALEIELIRKNIKKIILNSYNKLKPENEGVLFLKKDFNDLCELKLDELQTIGETIKRLRALTHGDYKNAFFIDPETGKKIFISIQLTLES